MGRQVVKTLIEFGCLTEQFINRVFIANEQT